MFAQLLFFQRIRQLSPIAYFVRLMVPGLVEPRFASNASPDHPIRSIRESRFSIINEFLLRCVW